MDTWLWLWVTDKVIVLVSLQILSKCSQSISAFPFWCYCFSTDNGVWATIRCDKEAEIGHASIFPTPLANGFVHKAHTSELIEFPAAVDKWLKRKKEKRKGKKTHSPWLLLKWQIITMATVLQPRESRLTKTDYSSSVVFEWAKLLRGRVGNVVAKRPVHFAAPRIKVGGGWDVWRRPIPSPHPGPHFLPTFYRACRVMFIMWLPWRCGSFQKGQVTNQHAVAKGKKWWQHRGWRE